jgi:hypothetical protein
MSRKLTITIGAAVLAVVVTVTVWLATRTSYDDVVKGCQKALAAQYKADGKGKPAACKDVKKGDYDALVLQAAMGHLGWTDKDGNFDENKMLDDATDQP